MHSFTNKQPNKFDPESAVISLKVCKVFYGTFSINSVNKSYEWLLGNQHSNLLSLLYREKRTDLHDDHELNLYF